MSLKRALIYQQLYKPRFISTRQPHTSYHRIRIFKGEDIERLYPLIAAYIQDPARADSVKEVLINTSTWSLGEYYELSSKPDLVEVPPPVSDGIYTTIQDHVCRLGMGKQETRHWLDHLKWKHAHQQGQLPRKPRHYGIYNQKFAQLATAIILSMCKNISLLGLSATLPEPLQNYLLKSNYNLIPNPPLQKLEHVIFLPNLLNDERSYDQVEFLDYFRTFHRFPALRSVSLEAVEEYQAERDFFVPETSAIKELHIGHCDVSGRMLASMIRIPRGLETLSVSMGGLWDGDMFGRPLVAPKTIGKALYQHRNSLKTLKLDIDYGLNYSKGLLMTGVDEEMKPMAESQGQALNCNVNMYETQMDEYFHLDEDTTNTPLCADHLPDTRTYGNTIGSLHDFTTLTHLQIGVKAFIETGPSRQSLPELRLVNMLPPNLETFVLTGYEKGKSEVVDEQVGEFMEGKRKGLGVEGVEEMVGDVATEFDDDDLREERLWKRPEMEWDWVKA